MDCHRFALAECGLPKARLKEIASTLSERDAKQVLQGENSALKLIIKHLELSNAKQAQKIKKLKENASAFKVFSHQLAFVDSELLKTLAAMDQDAGLALLFLKRLRSTVQKIFLDPQLCEDAALSMCFCIDEATRAINRICCHVPVSFSPASFKNRKILNNHAAVSCQLEVASNKREDIVRQSPERSLKPTERACSAQPTKHYVKALEMRLSLLEAEVAQYRQKACETCTGEVHKQLPSSSILKSGNANGSKLETKPLQAAKTIICNFIADPYAVSTAHPPR